MKFRKDFVTNSSSSSYICEICGDNVSGMDYGLSDAGMFTCENRHTICDCHARNLPRNVLLDLISQAEQDIINRYGKHSWAYHSEIPSDLDQYSDDDLVGIYFDVDDVRYAASEELCPICNFEKASDSDVINYLLKKYDTSRSLLLKEWRDRFKTYSDLKKYLRGK